MQRVSPQSSPLDFSLLGRMLLHSALVGAAAGLLGSLFFAGIELGQHLFLEMTSGYIQLPAGGERVIDHSHAVPFRPWLLWCIPALGGLCAGLISAYFAPETRGGGANAIINAFHHGKGLVRKRVAFVKAIVSIFTLSSGGSGGREGPTMQMGGAIGSLIGQLLRVSERERRILLVAGTAAGMAAIFRTPLGAALLAVEVLHRDDFEADALVPSVLASVVSYSVFISFFGEATLFTHAPRYPFIPAHLPLYGLMALLVSFFAVTFVKALEGVQHLCEQLPMPEWSKPALGGLVLGIFATPILVVMSTHTGQPGHGLGIMGGGYGAAQLAISGIDWLGGWRGVEILLVLGAVKALATVLTVGSGGSAGDFGPSLVLGALVGGAFGRAAQLVFGDPRLDPGAFALVGMGTFYGGLAHVPIAALVMVCELAGSYDLLVPLMLCEGIAFVALRRHTLYPAQLPTKRDSPAHRGDLILDVLKEMRVSEILIKDRPYVAFTAETPAREVIAKVSGSAWQDAFPVLSPEGKVIGMVSSDVMRTLASAPEMATVTIAHDMMTPPITVRDTDDLRTALETILEHSVRELIVVDATDRIVGFLDEAEITRIYHTATAREAASAA
jgi:CIC family chloride channel protein